MGLDMYLSASKTIGAWHHKKDDEKALYASILEKIGLLGCRCEQSPCLTIKVAVAYWRKANAIHAWFVREVQNGEDEGREHYVPRSKLIELSDLCKLLLESMDEAVAQSKLPPQAGFFGSSDIKDSYWMDLQNTVIQLHSILDQKEMDGMEFYYRASW